MLDAPLFATRWRWVATISLAVRRMRGGRKTPPPLQRMAAEDLIAVIFPDQLACAENLSGEREVPDHPLVRQVLNDCLHEAMDSTGLVALLGRMERGDIEVQTRDLPQPSPLAQEILRARPYAFLDDAPLEERRTQAVAARRWLDPETAAQFGGLDPAAIATVRAQAWPDPEGADELHDALMLLGVLSAAEAQGLRQQAAFDELVQQRRASELAVAGDAAAPARFWVAAEQLPMIVTVYPDAALQPRIAAPADYASRVWDEGEAVRELLRGRLQAMGPTTATALAELLRLPGARIDAALLALETEGFVLRGRFTPGASELEWCERRLLARIHHYTLRSLRAEIEPVATGDFMRFLLEWQGVTRTPGLQGADALAGVIEQLEGYEVPAVAWEADVLPARLQEYDAGWLDGLCLSGRVLWARLDAATIATAAPVRATPIALLTRRNWPLWQSLQPEGAAAAPLSASADSMAQYLQQYGASFLDEITRGAGLLPAQAESGLAELVARGQVSADSFGGLRALLLPLQRKRKLAARGRRAAQYGLAEAGRWSLVRRIVPKPAAELHAGDALAAQAARVEAVAWTLLRRYGVVFRRLLAREAPWLPPWHELLRALRRLEAQGQVRGGRFVAGVSGEQYALPDAVGALRAVRKRAPDGALVSLSAADPLNLAGIVTPGARVPALAGNRLLLADGVPIATLRAGEVEFLQDMPPPEQWRVRQALLRQLPRAGRVQSA
jgi:ATP-dependent Lhr-like helicase